MIQKLILIFFILLMLYSCETTKKTSLLKNNNVELNQLLTLMEGNFSSELQAKNDTNYFNISLVMTQIWKDRADGKWLYVEQSEASKLDKPYRQRVYHLQHISKNIFTSDIYTIKNAKDFAGLQNDNIRKDKLTFDLIELKEGCTVTLVKNKDIYEGGTKNNECPSDLRGAKYTTTKIILKNNTLQSWDQGFDEKGKQVWGATKGGYIFIKQ